MNDRLIDWLGLRERIQEAEGARVHFEWGNPLQGDAGLALLAGLAAVVALTVWLYRREGEASRLRKGFLAFLRIAAYACLLLVLLEPRLAVDRETVVEGHVVVLWDTSLSMSLPDAYRDAERQAALAEAAGLAHPDDLAALTRAEVAWRVVDRAGLLEGLAERNRLLVYAFDGAPRRVEGPAAPGEEAPTPLPREGDALPESLTPRGPATDLALAVRKALEDTSGRPVAALVAVTDGRLNKGEGRQGVKDALKRRGIPFHALGIGDPTPPQNLEVVELGADARVVLGDPMVIEGSVRARGYEGEQVAVELSVAPRAGGEPTLLERRDVRIPADDEAVPVSFRHAPAEKGDVVFSLRIAPREEEPVTDDNERRVTVSVTDDETRVLLLAGSPSFEYHFLKQRLVREKTAVLSCWLQSADPRFPQEGNERLEAMPTTIEELREFDLVILLDPNPAHFDAVVAEAYKTFVAEHKGGLLYVAGPKYSPLFLSAPDLDPFRDLLPVVPGELVSDGVATERWPLRATVDGADHPATRLDPDPGRTKALWSRLPGFFFSFPTARAKAGATILVRHDDPVAMTEEGGRPLLVAHFFDGGPAVWMGAAETWRWRSVGREVYDRYWVNLLRFLVQGRLAGGRQRLELLADKEEYPLGEPIRLRAHAFDRSYRPLEVERLTGRARVGVEEVELAFEPLAGRGQPGWYEAVLLPPDKGALEVSMRLPDDDPGAAPATLTLSVRLPDLEFSDPRLDEELLVDVAHETSGSLVAPSEVAGLPERIPSATERLVVAAAPIPLWDRWATVAAVVLLFTLEWALRKRSRMI